MVIEEFLANLRKLDVKFQVEGNRLRCNAPPGALTPDLQSEIKRRKSEILGCLEAADPKHGAAPPMERVSREGKLPLSFGQQRLWFLHQLEPDSAAYNIPIVLRPPARIDGAVLGKAVTEVARRHEALRTTFSTIDGQPVQVIAPPAPVPVEEVDFRGEPPERRDSLAEKFMQDEARRPFCLEKGPLWRCKVLWLTPDKQIVLFTLHHILCDRWSIGLLFAELSALENSITKGLPSPLPELPVQYADYAAWQRRWLQGETLERELAYWREHLQGPLPVMNLPTDRPRPPMQTYRAASRGVFIPGPMAEALQTLSQNEGATLFMTLLAAFKTLLYRHTGQTDLIVGTPIAGRNRFETERLIGFFINMLVLRTRFEPDATFRDLLARVRETAVGGYGHQDVPFEKLVEELQPARQLSHPPLFQVMFILQNVPKAIDVAQVQTLSFSPTGTTLYDLTLDLQHGEHGLAGTLDYNPDLFDDATIGRFLDHFYKLLEGIVAHPEAPLGDLPLLTDAEQILLRDFNSSQSALPAPAWVHEAFETAARQQPNAIALAMEEVRLTYADLNKRANQLARHLAQSGVGAGTRAAVLLERSPEMIVALLAILKAGGAYVPIDPATPAQRLEFLLKDSKPAVLVTQKKLAAGLPIEPERVVCLEAVSLPLSSLPDDNLNRPLQTGDGAYVIYTSGSTGQPKGVLVSHGAIAFHIQAARANYELSPADVVLQFSSLSFDASLEQIFAALGAGATLVVRGPEVWPTTAFRDRVLRHRLTVLDLPTAYWAQLAQEWAGQQQGWDKHSVRLVVVGGDVMSPDSLKHWHDSPLRSVRLLNAYGPTEATITATLFPVPPPNSEPANEWRIPIGRPLPGKRAHVLDRLGRPAPLGVPGELYLGGAGLALGYLNQPALTKERFVPDRFSEEPGALLYRTGDLARYRQDGTLEFLGRNDDQLKIRGYRVEPGEIEAVLRLHPAVEKCVVLARPDASGEKRLAAYLVPKESIRPEISELKDYIRRELPDYMVPGAFVYMSELPLTPGGKIDREALPKPVFGAEPRQRDFVMPRDELELQVAKIWEQVLGRHPIGVTDNFFELGGHSILAVKLFSRIEKAVGKHLPLTTLFENPTIAEQVKLFRQEGWKPPWTSLVPIQPGGSKPPLFVVHGVGGNVLFCRDLARHLGPDQPFYGLQSLGLDVGRQPHGRIEEMADHYLEEIRSLQPEGPYFLGGFCMGGMVAFEMARRLRMKGETVGLVALLETHGPGYFLSPRNNIQFFYEERTLKERIRANLQRLRDASPQERRALLERKIGLLRNKVEVWVTGWVTKLLLRFGHATLAALQRVHHHNVQAQMTYLPQSVYPSPVHLFRASKQPIGHYQFDPLYGWGMWAADVEVREFPGYHGTFMEEPYVSVFAEKLKVCLEQSHAASPAKN